MTEENTPRNTLPRVSAGVTLSQLEMDRLDQMAEQFKGNRSAALRAALVCYDRMLMSQDGAVRESVFELLLEKPT